MMTATELFHETKARGHIRTKADFSALLGYQKNYFAVAGDNVSLVGLLTLWTNYQRLGEHDLASEAFLMASFIAKSDRKWVRHDPQVAA